MARLSTHAEDLVVGARCGRELDAGDSVTATLALACFVAVRRIAPDADRELLARAPTVTSREGARPRDCERRGVGGERPVRARR